MRVIAQAVPVENAYISFVVRRLAASIPTGSGSSCACCEQGYDPSNFVCHAARPAPSSRYPPGQAKSEGEVGNSIQFNNGRNATCRCLNNALAVKECQCTLHATGLSLDGSCLRVFPFVFLLWGQQQEQTPTADFTDGDRVSPGGAPNHELNCQNEKE